MRKKLFAVIMSIMMMVTFMPTMAFAAGSYTDATVTKVEWNYDGEVTAKVSFTYDGGSDTVTLGQDDFRAAVFINEDTDLSKYDEIIRDAKLPEEFWGLTMVVLPEQIDYSEGFSLDYSGEGVSKFAMYIDFAGAKFVNNKKGADKINRITADTYCDMVDQNSPLTGIKLKSKYDLSDLLGNYIVLTEPSYIAGKKEAKTAVVSAEPTLLFGLPLISSTSAGLVKATATLPSYEKYQDSQNYPVTLSFNPSAIGSLLKSSKIAGVANIDKAVTDYQIYIDSGKKASSVDLIMDGMTAVKNITLYDDISGVVDLIDQADDETQAFLELLMPTFYNGTNQNLHATTQGVTVQYSKDGKTWGDAPEVKNADLSYLEVVLGALDSVPSLVEKIKNKEGGKNLTKSIAAIFAEPLEKIMNSLVYVKVTKGTSTRYGMVAPIVLPREFIVEYKNSQLNFAPGKNLTSKDVLEAKAINGYEALASALNTYAKKVEDENHNQQFDDVSRIVDTVVSALGLLKTEKAGFCDADKAYAEKFVEKYFSLKNMPTTGKDNKLVFAKNVKIDFNALAADMKTDVELLTFLNNYDLLPEIMMLDLSSLGELPLEALVNLDNLTGAAGETPSFPVGITVSTDVVKLLKSLLGLVDTGVISTATLNFDKDFTQITAKNATKTFHVKKAKALKKNKSFKFKATTDYGTVEYKKLSGNKKITVRDDGKITVKKGLKKGTYTVRVKVSVPEAGKYVKKSVKVKIAK